MTNSSTGLPANLAGVLCYALGWLSGLIFLILEKDSEFVKFHARQSIAVFGILTVASMVAPMLPLGGLIAKAIGALSFIAWILLMIFAAQEKEVRVPVASDLADKLA